jgi:arginase
LNVPATTPSGCVDGMVISHLIGRGAPELVRFWGEPPLVREPDIALFGVERLDPPEEQYLVTSALRRHPALEVAAAGGAAAARGALERVHAANHQFVLHFDVDVISSDEFPATDFPDAGGLSWSNAAEALRVFAAQTRLAAFDVAGYNPDLDPDGAAARRLIDLLVEVLAPRLAPASTETAASPTPVEVTSAEPTAAAAPVADPQSDSGAPPEPDSIPS